ncbi:MAG TPA: hypothetical protein GX700_04315, partial [Paracoccus sp.]|nr:hypothetical protein [Paracoccus sp. (in: a-proteobacteria)]
MQSPNTRTVFVATNRIPDEATGVPGVHRDAELHYARFDVAIPPDNPPGEVSQPRGGQRFDPSRHFAVADATPLSPAEYGRALAREMAQRPTGQRDPVV